MIKKRIIAVLLFKDGVLTRTKKFVPDYIYTRNQINTEHCDELCFIDLGGSRAKFFDAVNYILDEAMLPASIGGGIHSVQDAWDCLRECPCEKVVLESHLSELAKPLSLKYGNSTVVAGITEGRYDFPWEVKDYIGEVFIQSVERDGSLRGYPIEFAKQFSKLGVSLILGSGCGSWKDMLKGFEFAEGCSTSNIHHLTQTGMKAFKTQLEGAGIDVRTVNQVQSSPL